MELSPMDFEPQFQDLMQLDSFPLGDPVEVIDEEPAEQELFYYQAEDGSTLPLLQEDQANIAAWISDTYRKLDGNKSTIRTRWENTAKAVHGVMSSSKTDRYYGLVPFGKQVLQTLLSHFWGRSLQSASILFGIKGEDARSEESAPIMKELLLQWFRKIQLPQKLDAGAYDGIMKGVAFSKVSLREIKKKQFDLSELNRIDDLFKMGNLPASMLFGRVANMPMQEKTVSNYGPECEILSANDFVFDTERHKEWDSCFKAHRYYMVYPDIAENPNFKGFELLKPLVEKAESNIGHRQRIDESLTPNKDQELKGFDEQGRVELLDFHGDIRLPDGTYLRNWVVTVAAGRYIIRFEENPIYVNPFTKWEYEAADDGWGRSPLDYIVPLVDAGSRLLSDAVNAAALAISPPMLAVEGSLKQKKMLMVPGMIIDYKLKQNMPNLTPTPIQLRPEVPFPFVQYFEGQTEATTGATRQLSGNVTTNDKVQTATEFQGLQIVGNLILDRLVDLYNLEFKIPVIEKLAFLMRFTASQSWSIRVEDDNDGAEFQEVSPLVLFHDYSFDIEDSKSESERKSQVKERINLFQMGLQEPEIGPRMKKVDFAKSLWRDLGMGKVGKMFMDDQEFVEHQAKELVIAQQIQQAAQALAAQMMNGAFTDGSVPITGAEPGIPGSQGFNGGGGAPFGMAAEPGVSML